MENYESNYRFQARLHIATAVNYEQQGYNCREAFDFLQKAADLRYAGAEDDRDHFYKLATQNIAILRRMCQHFPNMLRRLTQFPFVLAR